MSLADSRLQLARHERVDFRDLGCDLERLATASLAIDAWGRSGVSYAGWDNAIKVRADAAKEVGFAGFIGYAWGKNGV